MVGVHGYTKGRGTPPSAPRKTGFNSGYKTVGYMRILLVVRRKRI